ncbi:MAG: LysE family translocator [Gammaproteobacteria bacterium]|nr:LysE family translocator [Gammaproteobacteria bacterium]
MEFLIPIFIFSASATITPGPNNIMLMTSGLNFGIYKSLPHYLGICLGFPVMVILIGLGFGFIFDRFPFMHTFIRIIGIGYLLFLSWKIANSAPNALETNEAKPFSFFQAVLFQWVNPKAWIMATSAIAAFTIGGTDIFLQVLMIALSFMIVAFPSTGIWLCFGVFLKKVLKNPFHQKIFNIVMAGLLVLSITPSAYDLIIDFLA